MQNYPYEDLMKAKDELRLRLNDAINGKKGAVYDNVERMQYFQEALEKIEIIWWKRVPISTLDSTTGI